MTQHVSDTRKLIAIGLWAGIRIGIIAIGVIVGKFALTAVRFV